MALNAGLVDTSVFVAREVGRPVAMDLMPRDVVVLVVTVAELRAGVLSPDHRAERAMRLSTLTLALTFESIPIDDDVAESWANLRIALRSQHLRMPVNDSWIGAMALRIPVVTQAADYVTLPGLHVIHV